MITTRAFSPFHSASLLTTPSGSWPPSPAALPFYRRVLRQLHPSRPPLTAQFVMASRRSARISAQVEASASASASPMPPPPPPASASANTSRKRKATSPTTAAAALDGDAASTAAAPSTPKRRGRKSAATAAIPPPATPTPSAVGLMTEPAGVNTPVTASQPQASPAAVTTPKPVSRAVARLADPNGTNATLLSPETSRVVAAKPIDGDTVPPSSQLHTTTANILAEACAHLTRTEPRLKPM